MQNLINPPQFIAIEKLLVEPCGDTPCNQAEFGLFRWNGQDYWMHLFGGTISNSFPAGLVRVRVVGLRKLHTARLYVERDKNGQHNVDCICTDRPYEDEASFKMQSFVPIDVINIEYARYENRRLLALVDELSDDPEAQNAPIPRPKRGWVV